MCLCIVLQLYSSIYFGWFFVFCLIIALLLCFLHPSYRTLLIQYLHERRRILLQAGFCSLLLLSPMIYHYFLAEREIGHRSFQEVFFYLPVWSSWLYLGQESWLYKWQNALFRTILAHQENCLGFGFATTCMVLWVTWRSRKRFLTRIMLAVALTLIFLTTRLEGGSNLWLWVYTFFPGANGLRAVSRIGMMFLFPGMIALAAFFQKIPHWTQFSLALLLILEQGQNLTCYNKANHRMIIDHVVATIPDTCRSFYLIAPHSSDTEDHLQQTAMIASLQKGIPTINGYSGQVPRNWHFYAHREASDNAWSKHYLLPKDSLCRVRMNLPPIRTAYFY